MTVFIKRCPSKGEFPKENDKDYCSNVGMVYFRKGNFYFRDEQLITFTNKVEWWLEEITNPDQARSVVNELFGKFELLPSEKDIEKKGIEEWWYTDFEETLEPFKNGANFILNKLKGE